MTKVEEIHAAVDEAAKTLLVDMPYDSARAKTLQAIGFVKSENVQDYNDHQTNHGQALYYRNKYPLYKFITRHQLEKISKKYNLISGNLSIFKGAIPDKNIDEMLTFKIFREDIDPKGGIDDFGSSFPRFLASSYLESDDYRAAIVGLPRERTLSASRFRSRHGAPYWEDAFMRDAERREERDKSRFMSLVEISREFSRACSITADRELFEQPARDLDPIVTVAVKGGFLIVTAWGAEASDPDVVNQSMN